MPEDIFTISSLNTRLDTIGSSRRSPKQTPRHVTRLYLYTRTAATHEKGVFDSNSSSVNAQIRYRLVPKLMVRNQQILEYKSNKLVNRSSHTVSQEARI
jgi:hypothetical protein